MSDRIDRALAIWRQATEHARAPSDLADWVDRTASAPGFAEAVWSLARPAFAAALLAILIFTGAAARSLRTFADAAAAYTISESE